MSIHVCISVYFYLLNSIGIIQLYVAETQHFLINPNMNIKKKTKFIHAFGPVSSNRPKYVLCRMPLQQKKNRLVSLFPVFATYCHDVVAVCICAFNFHFNYSAVFFFNSRCQTRRSCVLYAPYLANTVQPTNWSLFISHVVNSFTQFVSVLIAENHRTYKWSQENCFLTN